MNRFDWDDLRFVLAALDAGSLAGAARKLGVNHATVLRRIAGFEERTGVTIFERHKRGLVLAPQRKGVLAQIRDVERAVEGVSRALEAARSPISGRVRVTSTDSICQALLPPIVARLSETVEGLRIELNSTNLHLDLARLDADIAVRAASTPPEGLVSAPAGVFGFAAYAAPGAAPGWLGFTGPLARALPAEWMALHVTDSEITGRADSFVVLREMAAAGQGRTILPTILGEGDSRLMRLAEALPDMEVQLWVASHPDLAEVPRIRAVREMLVAALAQTLSSRS